MTASSSTPKLPVSVCIIAGNEASRIRRALESVAGWAGEIIVLLNHDVNDGTDKIAESFGAKVFREPWKGFGPQKNSALAKATQAWILNLDADEEITVGLRDEIQAVLARHASHSAFSFPRLTQFCGRWIRHGDWYPDRQIRLWLRGRARWSEDMVHETPVVDGSIGRLRSDLRHHMSETIDRQIAKIATYTEAFAEAACMKKKALGVASVLLRPGWRFIRSYVFRLGFLDGWQGAYIAWMTAFYTATRYAKLCAKSETCRRA